MANAMIAMGLVVMLLVLAIYDYSIAEQQWYAQQELTRRQEFEQERLALERYIAEQPTPQPVQPQAQDDPVALEEVPPVDHGQATVVDTALAALNTARTTLAPGANTAAPREPARRILIPAIGVDSEVVEAVIQNGEWSVPKFVVGHLQGTADPNVPGNSVYSGHLQSISSGNVFARLSEVSVGDRIRLVTAAGQYLYEVRETKVVSNKDLSVVAPTPDATVTLITCTGEWDFRTRDYLQRFIVIAKRYQDQASGPVLVQPR